jgi:D-galactarolactone cycloisomerase
MKITDVRLDRLRLPLDPPFRAAWDPTPRDQFDATVVRVETDEGVMGVGSGDTMNGFDAYRDHFVGTDPLQVMRQVRTIETINFHGGRFWPLEAALWDIVGQVAALPVATLFGNSTTRLPAYMSTGELKDPGERVESALSARELGFKAIKLRIDRDRVDEGVETVRAVREAVGRGVDLMVDLNQSWRMPGDVEPALDNKAVRRVVARLEDLGVLWVEEPLPYADWRGLRELRKTAGLSIAGGEMLTSFDEVLRYLDRDVLDVYQMDCVLAVGMHRARVAAELAQHRHRQFTPHSWTNGIGLLANLHVACGVGAAPYFEFPYDPDGWTVERRDFMLAEPIRIDVDGYVAIPDRPGLGVELADDAIARWSVS